jgi:hypothetical protein
MASKIAFCMVSPIGDRGSPIGAGTRRRIFGSKKAFS